MAHEENLKHGRDLANNWGNRENSHLAISNIHDDYSDILYIYKISCIFSFVHLKIKHLSPLCHSVSTSDRESATKNE